MAVSSSIGSNIFDILVGLPLPWLLKAIQNGASGKDWKIPLAKESTLSFSIIVLVAMLAAVIGTIAICKFRMTKALGFTMFGLVSVACRQQQFSDQTHPLSLLILHQCVADAKVCDDLTFATRALHSLLDERLLVRRLSGSGSAAGRRDLAIVFVCTMLDGGHNLWLGSFLE